MPNHNHVELMGHLARDPEIRFSQGGTKWATFTIAVNHTTGKGDARKQTTFWASCKCFGYAADNIEAASKGDCIWVTGYLETEEWTPKNGGEKKSSTRVVCNDAQRILWVKKDRGDSDGERSGGGRTSKPDGGDVDYGAIPF